MKAPGLSFDLDNMIWQSGAQRTPRAWQYACQDPNKGAECDSHADHFPQVRCHKSPQIQ